MSSAKPLATFRFGEMTSVDSWTTSPTATPPMSAPYADPRPPTTTAANSRRSRLKPLSNFTSSASPWNTPPRAANPAPTTHTTRMMRSTSMPDDAARSGLSATARTALPRRVDWRSTLTAISTMMAMTMVAMVVELKLTPATS